MLSLVADADTAFEHSSVRVGNRTHVHTVHRYDKIQMLSPESKCKENIYTVSQKNIPDIFSCNLEVKLSDFNNFWYEYS